MYEGQERRRFISDATYLREMQHKMDSEYQACLRKEQTRDQPEKKRELLARQEQKQTGSTSSPSAGRSHGRPWVSRLPVNRQQTFADEASGREPKPSLKTLGTKSEAKFPAIDKASVKKKQKPSTSTKKAEKGGPSPKKDTSASQKPILSRRQRMTQRSLLENPELENARKVEGKGRKTPVLQGIAKTTRGSDAQDGSGPSSSPVVKHRKKPQERRSFSQSSKLSIDGKNLERNVKKGNMAPAVSQQPLLRPLDSAAQVPNSPSASSESSSSNLPPIKNAVVRSREEDFRALLHSNVESSTGENEDTAEVTLSEEEPLSLDIHTASLAPRNGVSGPSVTQAEQDNCEVGVGGDGRRTELSHRLLRQPNVAVDSAAEQPSLGARKTREHRRPYALEEDHLEEAPLSEGEPSACHTRGSHAVSTPGSSTAGDTEGNLSSAEDWPGNSACGRERQSHPRNTAGLPNLPRATVQRPPVHSALHIPGSLAQPASRAEAVGNVDMAGASAQHVAERSGGPRLTAHRQLSPIRISDSFSSTESCPSLSPTFEDTTLLEDSTSSGLSSTSPTATSYYEDHLLSSRSSSSYSGSSHPSVFRANFTARLHVAGSLSEQVPILLTVSDLGDQSSFMSGTAAGGSSDAKEVNKPEIDPEKLKKLQESLLAEESEEEGDQCRICQIAGGSVKNPLLEPCGCVGTLRFVHQECLKTWLKTKIKSGAGLGAVKTCELCKQTLTANLDDFDVNDYYRDHQQSQPQTQLINSTLYLALVFHLYEQRFAELMRLNYNQASRDRISRQPGTEENQNPANSGTSG